MNKSIPRFTAEQAADLIRHGDNVGFSGFTPAGSPKAVPKALAQRATELHAKGEPFQIGVLTGASTGASLDGALAAADAISFRTPYQSSPELRKSINAGKTRFFDMHLSVLPQAVRYGFLGKINWAVIEACDVTEDGEIVLTAAVGASLTYCNVADHIIVELNRYHPAALRGFHDIYEPKDPPYRREIPVYKVDDRIGSPTIKVDPSKIVCIVETNQADETRSFGEGSDATNRIGQNVADFLAAEVQLGRIPKPFLPIQSGVGDTANAILAAMGRHPDIPAFQMYTEVIQDAVIGLLQEGRISFASGVSLSVSPEKLREVYDNLEFFRPRLMLRPQEVSNNPEVVRRLGLICINTALEVDLFGNVNSTHVLGKNMMNGIGGSADFTRNGYLSIFTCPSTAKGGKISTIVPLVSHMDQSEHSVQIVVTEQGVADLRGTSPHERARIIVEKCAHPDYRDQLRSYFEDVKDGHTPHSLGNAFKMHLQFMKTGDMHGVTWDKQ